MADTEVDLAKIGECHALDDVTVHAFANAARVCIDRSHEHEFFNPCKASHTHDERQLASLAIHWSPPDATLLRTQEQDEDAARDGAYAIAIIAGYFNLCLRFVGRRRTKDGADWVAESMEQGPRRALLIEVADCCQATTSPIHHDVGCGSKSSNSATEEVDGRRSLSS